jgi:hypothetical protein
MYETRTPLEAKTHQMLADHLKASNTGVDAAICHVFRAFWEMSYSTKQIVALISAIHGGWEVSECIVQRALSNMVAAGVLRSRVTRKVRFYEVNY